MRYYRSRNLTIEGRKVDRKASDYPYSYTRVCLYKNEWQPTDEMVYSDRLHLWYENYRELFREKLGIGQYFTAYPPEQIESFLSELFGKKITLTGIEEECNMSNGYPYWLLYYRKGE